MKNHIQSLYERAERFAALTKILIMTGNVARARKMLAHAEKLLIGGNIETRNAISNVYVFSVSTFMEVRKCNIANLFPPALKADYVQQVNAPGV